MSPAELALDRVLERLGSQVPAALLAARDQIARAPEAARPRLVGAVRSRWPALAAILPEWAGPLCPAYPEASEAHQARLALGESPAEILRGLTRAEAHAALRAGAICAADWIVPAELRGSVHVRSLAVARWLAACWADPPRRTALEQQRQERGPGDAVIEGRLIDRVDEIVAGDLPGGPKTGVQQAFAAAAARIYSAWEHDHERAEEPLATIPRWWRPIRCARLLRSAAALIREGRQQHHCVGSYAGVVRRGSSVIVALAVPWRGAVLRSTAEISRSELEVLQHRGARNAAPHPVLTAALESCLRRWRA